MSAEGQTGQQVASTEPGSWVASYHAGIGLGSTGWLVASDGRGQHGVGLHKSPPVNQASKRQGGGHVRALPDTTALGQGMDGWVHLPDEARPSPRKAAQVGGSRPFLSGRVLSLLWIPGFGPQNLSTINSDCLAFCRAPKLQARRARMKGHWEILQFLLSFPQGQDG